MSSLLRRPCVVVLLVLRLGIQGFLLPLDVVARVGALGCLF
jgi:hypothetical protein